MPEWPASVNSRLNSDIGEDPPGMAKDPQLVVTPKWRERVRAALKAHGISQARLSQRVGCSAPMMSMLLAGEIGHSALVAPISEELGLELPETEVTSAEWRQWIELGRRLTKRQRQRLIDMVQDIQDE